MKLIGLVGRMGAGKSTVADIITTRYQNWTELTYAGPLKDLLQNLFFLGDNYLYTSDKDSVHPELNVQPRQLLQCVGTNLMREQLQQMLPELNTDGLSIWIWHLKKRLYEQTMQSRNVVVSDVRFEDELSFIRSQGGIIINISRTSSMSCQSNVQCSSTSNHASEQLSTTADFNITNDGTMDDLIKMVHNIMKSIH